MATRRAILGQIALGLGVLACRNAIAQPAEGAAYLAVETSARTGHSRARFIAGGGRDLGTVPLGFRAHGMAQSGDTLLVFPRRPGTRFAVMDAATLEIRAVVDAPEGRHFYGHGALSKDGRLLLVTENDLMTLGGALGIYEIGPRIRRRGTIPLPRPGPHDIARIPGTNRFHLALGGLQTHPDYGRLPLNLDTFASEVVTLSLDRDGSDGMGLWDGAARVSLRHLAIGSMGRMIVGGQRQPGETGGVLWLVENGHARQIDPADRLAGYVSSVAAQGHHAIATSKTANLALRFDGDRIVGEDRLDGASAAALGRGRDAQSGYTRLRLDGQDISVSAGHEFDNHGALIAL